MTPFTCGRLDEALEEGGPAGEAARAHAEECVDCRDRLEAWVAVSTAAVLLRHSAEAQDLWPRIREALGKERERRARRRRVAWPLAAAATLAVATGAGLVYRAPGGLPGSEPEATSAAETERRLLSEEAVREVERAEADYVASIDRLAKLARPLLQEPRTALLSGYGEKLDLLDTAIAECRAQVDRNRFNAHLRRELLAIYQEKRRTLQQLVEERT